MQAAWQPKSISNSNRDLFSLLPQRHPITNVIPAQAGIHASFSDNNS
jgi:hypothetical protein